MKWILPNVRNATDMGTQKIISISNRDVSNARQPLDKKMPPKGEIKSCGNHHANYKGV
jgi:hypothetical protein